VNGPPTAAHDYKIFDVHQHVGDLAIGGGEARRGWDAERDHAQRVPVMDRYGIHSASVLPSLQYLRPNGVADTRRINDLAAAYRSQFQDRFPIAAGTVEPLHGVEPGVEEIRRIAEDLKLNALVWHHRFQGTFINDPSMHPFLDAAAHYRLPVYIHLFAESTMESPWGLEALAERHADVRFIALDAFSGSTQARYMMGIAQRCPNVLFETACVFPLGRILEEFVGRFGSERLVFGTDLYLSPPMYNHPHVLYEVLEAPSLTDADRRNIFWNNARRLFGLPLDGGI
jgi:predicted TIM-barrel fold metal-dependent hydrolase